MSRVEVGKQEANGDRLDLGRASDRLGHLDEIGLAERRYDLARGVDPLVISKQWRRFTSGFGFTQLMS